MKHLYSNPIIFSWWLGGSLCGAQIPQKVPGYIQSSHCKLVCLHTNILICYNYNYNYTVIIRLNSILIFILSKILTIWWIDVFKTLIFKSFLLY